MPVVLEKYGVRIFVGCICVFFMLAALLNDDSRNAFISLGVIIQLIFAPLYFVIVLTAFFLKDVFYLKKKFILFFCSLFILCLIPSVIIHRFMPASQDYSFGWVTYFLTMVVLIGIAFFLKFMKEQLKSEMSWTEFKARQNEAELKLLKQQLNPHFLFNTLNSIYAKCIEDKPEAGEMVLQLSDMLRYQLENDSIEKISLLKELTFLNNYVYFEKRRLPLNLNFNYSNTIKDIDLLIAPNILITLVENAFKHVAKLDGNSYIDIDVSVANSVLQLTTKNAYQSNKPVGSTKIGIENLKKRLNYLYRENYILEFSNDENSYYAKLTINL
jgi:two-component system, LytTR family, sensor kinase